MCFGCASTTVWHRSKAARYASAGPSWRVGSAGVASSLIEPNFGGGHPDQRDAPTALDGRSMQLANRVCWDRRRPASRSDSSRESWLRRSDCDMANPSVCERRNAPLSGYLDAGLLENKTVASVKSQYPVDAERSQLPSRAVKPNRVSPLLSRFGPRAGFVALRQTFVRRSHRGNCLLSRQDVCGNAQVVFAIKTTVRFCLPLCQNLLCQIPAG